jgi:hypothetical protein
MPLDAKFVPLQAWPGEKTRARKSSPFGVKYQKLLDDLDRELKQLRARDVVIQAHINESDVRNDGWPRSSARFYEPGIILSFRAGQGEEISFPCDTYRNWDSNLRAICLTLTALRAIDRYGVTKRAEQYKGWRKLAAPQQEQRRDGDWALNHLAHLANVEPATIRGNATAIDLAYRAAARRTHPDTGGNTEAFQLLQDAVDILRRAA